MPASSPAARWRWWLSPMKRARAFHPMRWAAWSMSADSRSMTPTRSAASTAQRSATSCGASAMSAPRSPAGSPRTPIWNCTSSRARSWRMKALSSARSRALPGWHGRRSRSPAGRRMPARRRCTCGATPPTPPARPHCSCAGSRKSMGGNQRGTVGRIELYPNLVNVVAERAVLTVDLRNTDEARLQEAEQRLADFIDRLAAQEQVAISTRSLARFEPSRVSRRDGVAGRSRGTAAQSPLPPAPVRRRPRCANDGAALSGRHDLRTERRRAEP